MERRFTVAEHLDEMRYRVIVSLIALGIATVASIPFAPYILAMLKSPAAGVINKLAFFGPEEAFMIYMRVSFVAGIFISFPIIAYQIWAFVAPAIGGNFKKYIIYFLFSTSFVFATGCLFAYFMLIPNALKFLLNIGQGELEPVISATRYISFTTFLIIACGLVFQMPILAFFLTKVGLMNAKVLRKNFKYALIIIFVLAAVITPTGDAFNMLALALPMLFLYEVSIWVSWAAGFSRKEYGYGKR